MSPKEFTTEIDDYPCLEPDANHEEPIRHKYIDPLSKCKTKSLTVQLVNLDLNKIEENSNFLGKSANKSGVLKKMMKKKRIVKKQKGFCSQNRKLSVKRNRREKKKNINFPASYSLYKYFKNNDNFRFKSTKGKCIFQKFEAITPKVELRIVLERLSVKEIKQYSRSYEKIIEPKVILHRLSLKEIGKYNIHNPKLRGKQIMTTDRKKRTVTLHTEKCGVEDRKGRVKSGSSFKGRKSFKCKDEDLRTHSCTDFVPQIKVSTTPKETLRNWEVNNYGWSNQSVIEKKRKTIVVCEECREREVRNDVNKSQVSRKMGQLMKALSLRGIDKPITRCLCVCGQIFI